MAGAPLRVPNKITCREVCARAAISQYNRQVREPKHAHCRSIKSSSWILSCRADYPTGRRKNCRQSTLRPARICHLLPEQIINLPVEADVVQASDCTLCAVSLEGQAQRHSKDKHPFAIESVVTAVYQRITASVRSRNCAVRARTGEQWSLPLRKCVHKGRRCCRLI